MVRCYTDQNRKIADFRWVIEKFVVYIVVCRLRTTNSLMCLFEVSVGSVSRHGELLFSNVARKVIKLFDSCLSVSFINGTQ
jgi:hypothetical protein